MEQRYVKVDRPAREGASAWDKNKIRPVAAILTDQQGNVFAIVPNDSNVLSKVTIDQCIEATDEAFEIARAKWREEEAAHVAAREAAEAAASQSPQSTEGTGDGAGQEGDSTDNTGGADGGSELDAVSTPSGDSEGAETSDAEPKATAPAEPAPVGKAKAKR